MKNLYFSAVVTLFFVACNTTPPKMENTTVELSKEELVKKGEYLVNAMGCADCHSAKMMTERGPAVDPATHLAGHVDGDISALINKDALQNWMLFNMSLTAAVGPWGISYAANITSDQSGIGTWTEEQFFRAMREGQYKGLENTRKLLPPMPWQNFALLSDEDLRAIFYYLKSTPPVHNVVPPPSSL